jgi:hypothetical protein
MGSLGGNKIGGICDAEWEWGIECKGWSRQEGGGTGQRLGWGAGWRPRDGNMLDGPLWGELEGAVDQDEFSFSLKAKIVEELRCRRMAGLQVPSFVKDGVRARLYNAGSQIKVDNVLGSRCVVKKYPCEVVLVKFAAPHSQLLDTHAGAEGLEVLNVGFLAVPSFVWCFVSSGMD